MTKHNTYQTKLKAVDFYLEWKGQGLTTLEIAEIIGISISQLRRWVRGDSFRVNDSQNDVKRSDANGKHDYPKTTKHPKKRKSKYQNETPEEKKARMKIVNHQKYLKRKKKN